VLRRCIANPPTDIRRAVTFSRYMHCIEVVSGISGDVGCFAIAALKLVVRSMSGGDYGGAYIALSTGANTFERVISSSWFVELVRSCAAPGFAHREDRTSLFDALTT
jgi:hypothetical protein